MLNVSGDFILTRPEIFVVDWDGVIQFIEKTWLVGIKKRPEVFGEYFDLERIQPGRPEFIRAIMTREDYYLDRWLLKEGKSLPPDVRRAFLDVYALDPYFYQKSAFFHMAEALMVVAAQDFCQKIIFLTHVPFADGEDARKRIVFEDRFRSVSDKFELAMIPGTKPKWEWIAENAPDYTVFIDDRYDIVRDVATRTDSATKTFLIPEFGYNTARNSDLEFQRFCLERRIAFASYIPKFIPA